MDDVAKAYKEFVNAADSLFLIAENYRKAVSTAKGRDLSTVGAVTQGDHRPTYRYRLLDGGGWVLEFKEFPPNS